MTEPRKLLTFEFVGLFLVTFVAFCNVTVFYDLFNYLQTLGIKSELCGLVIGSYSLTAMALYLFVSPFLHAGNAPRTMLIGMAVVAVCGVGYLTVHSFWGLMGLRMVNGLGQFLMGAGATALFVAVIPPERSGHAFAVYSVAILLPYGVVPALMDALSAFIPTPPHGYAGAAVTLLPAAWIVRQIRIRRMMHPETETEKRRLPAWADIRADLMQVHVALLILLSIIYLIGWSSMFFLFKGFASQQGIANVGSFFSVQMALMIVIRLLAGRFFDAIPKARLVMVTFAAVALGFLAMDHLPGAWAVPLPAIVFGVGMGIGQPALNGMMFEVSAPRFRALNANLMLFAVQAGSFFGPVLGGIMVAWRGYHGYFLFSMGLALSAMALGALLAKAATGQNSGEKQRG
jgi:MFS family permease